MFPGNIRSLNENSGNNNSGPGCKEYIQGIWQKIPLFVRIVIITSITIYLFTFIPPLTNYFVYYLLNIPALTIYKLHIFSVFTTVFVNTSIFTLFFALISWVPSAIQQEQQSGTIKYMINFLMHSTIIQVLYVFISFLLVSAISSMFTTPSSGLWPLLMAEITVSCCADPEKPVVMMFIPYPFKAKYYPWALIGFFSLLNGFQSFQFDAVIGIIYGYSYSYYLKNYFKIPDDFINRVDNWFPFKYLKTLTGYISLNSNSSFTIFNNQQPRPSANTDSRSNSQQRDIIVQTSQPSSNPVVPFKGRGTVVGGSQGSSVDTSLSQTSSNIHVNTTNNDNKKNNDKYHGLKDEEEV